MCVYIQTDETTWRIEEHFRDDCKPSLFTLSGLHSLPQQNGFAGSQTRHSEVQYCSLFSRISGWSIYHSSFFLFSSAPLFTTSCLAQGNPFDLKTVQAFILNMFVSARRNNNQVLYHHFTTAVDTENVQKVFGAVKEIILQKHLEKLMLQ